MDWHDMTIVPVNKVVPEPEFLFDVSETEFVLFPPNGKVLSGSYDVPNEISSSLDHLIIRCTRRESTLYLPL